MKKFVLFIAFFLLVFFAIEQKSNKKERTDAQILQSCKDGVLLDCSTAALISQDKIQGDSSGEIDFQQVAMAASDNIMNKGKENPLISSDSLMTSDPNEILKRYLSKKQDKNELKVEEATQSTAHQEEMYDTQKEQKLLSACKNSNYTACFNLAYAYETGESIKKDNSKALEYYIRSCKGKVAPGCYIAGLMYSNGLGSSKNITKAVDFYEKSCNNNSPDGCYSLAEFFRVDKKVKNNRVIQLYTKSCDMKNAKACFVLGEIHYNGELNIVQDVKKAINYFNIGCNGLNEKACLYLGRLYEVGKDVDKDLKKAVTLYRSSCDLGSVSGCTNLGNLYRTGKGIDRNYYRAATLFKKSCLGKDATACLLLGYLYEHGKGVSLSRTKEKAKEYYDKSCEYGESQGCQLSNKL